MKKIFLILLTALACAGANAQIGNAAHGGSSGIYVFTAFDPCSSSKPNAEGGVKVKVERRTPGGAWQQIGFLQTPETIGELTRLYHHYYRYNLAKELSKPDILLTVWEQYKKYPRWDSLGSYLNERAAGLAMGYLYLDTTAQKNTAYEYQMTLLGKGGNLISSKTTNAASYPDVSAFKSQPVAEKIEGSGYEVKISWRMAATKRPTFFKVYKRSGAVGQFEIIQNQFDISRNPRTDSVTLNFSDRAIGENQVYFYYAVAVDAYGNTSLASDTAVAKTYNTTDILLPQYFAAKSFPAQKAIRLSWKVVNEQSIAGIEIFRGEKYDGDYISLGLVSGHDTAFVDAGVKPAVVYYYYQ